MSCHGLLYTTHDTIWLIIPNTLYVMVTQLRDELGELSAADEKRFRNLRRQAEREILMVSGGVMVE